jgi:hypothetical protein
MSPVFYCQKININNNINKSRFVGLEVYTIGKKAKSIRRKAISFLP